MCDLPARYPPQASPTIGPPTCFPDSTAAWGATQWAHPPVGQGQEMGNPGLSMEKIAGGARAEHRQYGPYALTNVDEIQSIEI